jgi:hypothetical protein
MDDEEFLIEPVEPTKKAKAKNRLKQEKGFFEAYAGLAKTFRGWLVAYGVGAPVLLLSQEATMNAVKSIPDARSLIIAFLIGTLLQVGLAWVYKLCMWWAYMEEIKSISQKDIRFRIVDWFTDALWLEAVVDLGSICLFAWATARILIGIVK